MSEIATIIITLRRGIAEKKPVKITTHTKAGKQFVNILQREQRIKNVNKKQALFQSSMCDITSVDRTPVGVNEILFYASEQLPSATGSLVISTHRGIMTHLSAVEKNLGGRISPESSENPAAK